MTQTMVLPAVVLSLLLLLPWSALGGTVPAGGVSSMSVDELQQFWLEMLDMKAVPLDGDFEVPEYMEMLYSRIQHAEDSGETTTWSGKDPAIRGIRAAEVFRSTDGIQMEFHFSASVQMDAMGRVELLLARPGTDQYVRPFDDMRLSACVRGWCDHSAGLAVSRLQGRSHTYDVLDMTALVREMYSGMPISNSTDNISITLAHSRATDLFLKATSSGDAEALMVIYNNIPDTFHALVGDADNDHISRSRRSADSEGLGEGASTTAQSSIYCHLYAWHVPFETLGWGHWIIHPQGFNANFCHGSCPGPLVKNGLNMTNHAFLVSLYRARLGAHSSELLPEVHCVAVSYKPLSILFVDENGDYVLQHMESMSATSCGCL